MFGPHASSSILQLKILFSSTNNVFLISIHSPNLFSTTNGTWRNFYFQIYAPHHHLAPNFSTTWVQAICTENHNYFYCFHPMNENFIITHIIFLEASLIQWRHMLEYSKKKLWFIIIINKNLLSHILFKIIIIIK